ncbi:unnamed protein product [Mucor circinelloides]
MQHTFLIHKITTIQNNMIILGDFNYKYEFRRANGTVEATTVEWTTLLEEHFIDCFWENKSATFHGPNRVNYILDYIFCNNASYATVIECNQEYLNKNWTDHEMLIITIQLQKDARQGPGAYKCNPFLAKNNQFRRDLVTFLQGLQPQVEIRQTAGQSPQEIWDWIKEEFKEYVRKYQLAELNWRRQALRKLQAKRNRWMRAKKNWGLIFQGLETINQLIGDLQDSIAEIEVLKLGKYWRENGETNAGFLKKLTVSRQNKRQLKQLRHPVTQELHSDQDTMSEIAGSFYTNLYTPTAPDARSMRLLLTQITPDMQLNNEQQSLLELPIDMDDLLLECKRSPRYSSPGSDGIPYQLLRLILLFTPLQPLIEQVYNDALTKGIFPASWNISLMTILYKKNDPNDMANYRPISLCNTDYKLLTRLLNQRMMGIANQIINENQAGFIPGRFIADNAMRCQVVMEDAERTMNLVKQQRIPVRFDPKGIGLSLDQEKAYDRVNLHYLKNALVKYGFPTNIIRCLVNMMGQNQLRININGYFTDDVPKLRGLKQGDPISSILYNLAIEPFLRSVITDPLYKGYQMRYAPDHPLYQAEAPEIHQTKILCYADDAFAFIQDLPDLARLEYHLNVYCQATNAKINYNKVEAISLSGRNTWSYWRARLTDMNITKFTTNVDTNPMIYLGFPLIQSYQQREVFLGGLLNDLRTYVKIHSQRNLSVVGKATVLNSLILAKCWHVLRVTPFPQNSIRAIQSVCSQFLRKGIFPTIPWTTWIKPKLVGGLGVLDVAQQQSALYFRWLQPILHPSDSPKILDLMLVMLVNKQNQSAHVHVPILFPNTRTTGLTKLRSNTVTMLYTSADRVQRDFDSVHINIATSMILPLQAIFQPHRTDDKLPIKAAQLTVGDLYRPCPDQPLQLEARTAASIPSDRRRARNKIMRQITTNKVHLQPFFENLIQPHQEDSNRTTEISFSPFTESLHFNNQSGLHLPVSTRTFRKACTDAYTSHITSSNWKFFWSLSLTLVQRNVIYRFITKTIPARRLLHYFQIADTPLCPICGNEENAVHLLFLCPDKVSTWKAIIFEFLWPTVSVDDIIQACTTLDFDPIKYVSKHYTTAPMVVLVTLSNIWRAHFRLIFSSAPFTWTDVVNQVKDELIQLHNENELHKQL